MLLAACASTKVEPGYYRVQSGDTLSQIARRQDQSVGDLMRWNQLHDSNQISVGQTLRVVPPGGKGKEHAQAKKASTASTASAPSSSSPVSTPVPFGDIKLIWPASGKVARGYDGSKSNGLAIVDSAGTPVVAAAAGTVAYASNGLRGYGNLVIIQHHANFLTIYAHNRTLLVRQGQTVTQGQKIAEMGNSDSSRVELYFELRHGGKAVDPARALPSR